MKSKIIFLFFLLLPCLIATDVYAKPIINLNEQGPGVYNLCVQNAYLSDAIAVIKKRLVIEFEIVECAERIININIKNAQVEEIIKRIARKNFAFLFVNGRLQTVNLYCVDGQESQISNKVIAKSDNYIGDLEDFDFADEDESATYQLKTIDKQKELINQFQEKKIDKDGFVKQHMKINRK